MAVCGGVAGGEDGDGVKMAGSRADCVVNALVDLLAFSFLRLRRRKQLKGFLRVSLRAPISPPEPVLWVPRNFYNKNKNSSYAKLSTGLHLFVPLLLMQGCLLTVQETRYWL